MFLSCERFVGMDDSSFRDEDLLFFFTKCKEKFSNSDPIEEWRTRYGMTLLMVMVDIKVANPASRRCMRLLVEKIIKKEIFDDAYINHRAGVDLGLSIQFELRAILELNQDRYPTLFQNPDPRSQAKHPLFQESELKGNCKMIIERVDAATLRSKTIFNNKTAKAIIQEKIDQGNAEFEEMKDSIIAKIAKK